MNISQVGPQCHLAITEHVHSPLTLLDNYFIPQCLPLHPHPQPLTLFLISLRKQSNQKRKSASSCVGYIHLPTSMPRFSVFPAVSMDNCLCSQVKPVLHLCRRHRALCCPEDIASAILPSNSYIIIFHFLLDFCQQHLNKLHFFLALHCAPATTLFL